MSVAGIIAEFNPLHNGHAHLLSEAKKIASDGVVVVQSGNFTQRGTPAVLEKHRRAETALLCGADLVLELPLAFSVAGAQTFAYGGVSALDALGAVDTLLFGSECGKIEHLQTAADALFNLAVESAIHERMQAGAPFAAAREQAVRAVYGEEIASLLQTPNNILGIEYLRALRTLSSKITPQTVLRIGTPHDARETADGFASGQALRQKIENGEDVRAFLPTASLEILCAEMQKGFAPAQYAKLDVAVLAFLRKSTAADFSDVPDVSEGIENRILTAARTARTLFEVFGSAKTKRYTHARLRRIVLCAFLGVRRSDAEKLPYLRVLGFSERGKAILRAARQSAKLPIVMRASDIEYLSASAQRSFTLECRATDIYNLTLPEIRPCGTEMTENLVRI